MVANLSIYLVFALVVLPYYPILCQDNEWQSLIDQAHEYGVSQETIDGAQNYIGNSSMEEVTEEALRDGSLADWVLEATEDEDNESKPPPVDASTNLPSDVENSPNLAPNFPPNLAPNFSPNSAPSFSPNAGPELAPNNAPFSAPSPAPYAESPKA
ncbi:unnamed protein product [Lathyrus sativus]|nr:unnamed protein product [Lathyrus sativus]